MTQGAFGNLVGISQQAVSDMLSRGVIQPGGTAGDWLAQYCHHLREQAAGRAAAGDLDLAAERARLAKAQREKIEMQNEVTRRMLASVDVLQEVVARSGRRISGVLEAIPVQLKRRSSLTPDDLDFITREIVKARNQAASITVLDLLDEDDVEDPDGTEDQSEAGGPDGD
ncbi:terminase small subunit [Noviherbaspirillum humi]|nr:terminase small subunit [Noviherbaspirillum humi]